jgi:hypothetical protein
MRGGDYSSWARLARVKGEGETMARVVVGRYEGSCGGAARREMRRRHLFLSRLKPGPTKTRGYRLLVWSTALWASTRVAARRDMA